MTYNYKSIVATLGFIAMIVIPVVAVIAHIIH